MPLRSPGWIGPLVALGLCGATLRGGPAVLPATRAQGAGVRLEYQRATPSTRFLQLVGFDLSRVRALGLELEVDAPTQLGIYLVLPGGETRWRYVVFTPTSMRRSLRLPIEAFDPEPSASWEQVPEGGALILVDRPGLRRISRKGAVRVFGLQLSSGSLPLPGEMDPAASEAPPDPGYERVLAAWRGKALGGRAGMDVEGRDAPDWDALERTGWADLVPGDEHGFGPDDDSTLGVASLLLAEKLGRLPTPSEIAIHWLGQVSPEIHWDNSWAALKRFRQGQRAPETGRGPLGETLSARIRIDPWGLVFPGDPTRAAAAAASDASLTSFGSGLEDARFVAAALARAQSGGSLEQVWREAAEQIRGSARDAALQGFQARAGGSDLRAAYAAARERWFQPLREGGHRDKAWVFSLPNLALMGLAVAYGGEDSIRVLRLATFLGWDSDCNAGTLGAILGALRGEAAFPEAFVASLDDRLRVALPGQEHWDLRVLARRTRALTRRLEAGAPATPSAPVRDGGP